MRTSNLMVRFAIAAFALASCGTPAAIPTDTPVPTSTPPPTLTFTPEPTPTSTPTAEPTHTPPPPTATASAPVLPMPSGKPASQWNGIPIMPKAIAGEESNGGYDFTIKATPDEIQQYYEKALSKTGWILLGSGKGDTGAVLFFFTKGADTLIVSIFPQPEDLMLVMLVK